MLIVQFWLFTTYMFQIIVQFWLFSTVGLYGLKLNCNKKRGRYFVASDWVNELLLLLPMWISILNQLLNPFTLTRIKEQMDDLLQFPFQLYPPLYQVTAQCRWWWWQRWWCNLRMLPSSLGLQRSATSYCGLPFSHQLAPNSFSSSMIASLKLWHPNVCINDSNMFPECKERREWGFQKYDRKPRRWQGCI